VFFDSHCHLTAEQFDGDRDEVIERARDQGVTRMLTLGTDVASSRAAVELAERHVGVYAAVGIHPESVRGASPAHLEQIRALAAHPRVAAIGEIGLDLYWDKTTIGEQQFFFERQLDLGAELGLPVSIHDREAHDRIIQTLESVARAGIQVRAVLHAFSGDLDLARRALALGHLISLGGPITFRKNTRAAELIRGLPTDKLLLETDSPYLAPHPFRGKRNEPANVRIIAEHIAALKGVPVEQVAEQTTRNASALFRRTGPGEMERDLWNSRIS
jgi:TatD DNase family protein